MTAECVAEPMDREAIRLGGISPSWLADQLDAQGVVRLPNVFSDEWLEAMRGSVTSRIERHGDGDLFITRPDHEVGSPAHQVMSDPGMRRLLDDTAALRRPSAGSTEKFECNVPVRSGTTPKMRSNLFHYDASILTMVIPIFIPRAEVGNCGELAAFGNKRPFRRFAVTHLIETALTHNSLYRRLLLKKVNRAPEQYVVDLAPGDAYVFWGYRQFHGNLVCAPGLLRATLVVSFGEMHSDSWALKTAWRFSRSERDLGRLQYPPATSVGGP